MKHFISLTILLIHSFFLFGQPANYYSSASGLSGAPLKTALYNIIKGHTAIGYDNLWPVFQVTDDQNNQGALVWDMYSNCSFTFGSEQCGSYSVECDCYNKEHSFPQSWFSSASPMVSDLFQVYPTDGKVNGIRDNFPYGEVGSADYTSTNGSKRGSCITSGYNGTVFEPADVYKGDFARTYFYMATRYENLIGGWQSKANADDVLDGTSFPCYDSWFLNLLGEWHVQDPVSQKEIERNNDIYTLYQNNRNPYIDHPEYVYQVWGVGTPPVLPEPSNFPSDFSAHNIHLQWTDAIGSSLPAGYLIRMSSSGYAAISDPVDGIQVPDGPADKNVPFGTMNAWFSDLNPNTTYYFKLFGYTGSGSGINYKTDGFVPQLQLSTSP
jgi:endonuclease I